MSGRWGALAARARGLATHLLGADRLSRLRTTASLGELTAELRDTPYGRHLVPDDVGRDALELAITRSLAERMALLSRWAGTGGGVLRALYLAQDAHSVREIVRGILGGSPPERRAAGAIPTPLLGRRELEALARADTVAAVAATLTAWGHPLGSALLDEGARAHPDAYRAEAALARRSAAEVARAARRGGRRMRAFVRDEVDAGNAVDALLLAGVRTEGDAADFFIEGGSSLGRDDFAEAATAPDRTTAADLLAVACADTVLTTPLREGPSTPAALSARILAARIDDLVRRSRLEPVSALPVLLFALRLRREAQLVRRALWSAALVGGRRT